MLYIVYIFATFLTIKLNYNTIHFQYDFVSNVILYEFESIFINFTYQVSNLEIALAGPVADKVPNLNTRMNYGSTMCREGIYKNDIQVVHLHAIRYTQCVHYSRQINFLSHEPYLNPALVSSKLIVC